MPDVIHPVLIGAANAESATGMSWRHLRDHAQELGVPIVAIGRRRAVRTADLLAALAARDPVQPTEPEDPTEAMRRRIGLRARGAR